MESYMEWLKKENAKRIVENAIRAANLRKTVKAGKYEWIVNEPETADESSPIGGSWKEYWIHGGDESKGKVNEWPDECSVSGCTRKADHGAHVRDENGGVFIIPMCAKDNNPHNKEDMRINLDTIMVPAPPSWRDFI